MLRPHRVPSLRHPLRAAVSAKPSQGQCRTISSTPVHKSRLRCSSDRQHIPVLKPPWSAHPSLPLHRISRTPRFTSTSTRASPIAEVTSSYPSTASQTAPNASLPIEPTFSEPLSFSETPNYLEDILNDAPPQINEYIGFLKDMGLDYGWGPTAVIETVLEYIRITAGTPWWASVGLTVIGVRLALFKLYINAQDTSARQMAIKPLREPLEERQRGAPMDEMRALQSQRQKLNREYGIKPLNLFWPLLFQVPLGFGTFRLMRGMAGLPVPGFDQGGFLWLADLTNPDPFYILPLATAATYYWTFRLGGDTGGAGNNLSPSTYRAMLYGLPCMTGLFAMWWPVGLQIPIFLNGIIGITQNLLFRQNWFRAVCGIQPLGVLRNTQRPTKINRGSPVEEPAPKGFVGTVRKFYSDMVEQGKKVASRNEKRTGRTDAETKKAKAYEEKIAREAAQRRFEAKQAKEAREEERRQRSPLY